MQICSILAAAGAVAFAACSDVQPTAPTTRPGTSSLSQSAQSVGGVFVSTNGLNGNAVVAFARAADGSLTPTGTFATGGTKWPQARARRDEDRVTEKQPVAR